MNKLKANPYHKEIIATYILAPILMLMETWRRWDNLLSMSYFDDVILVVLAGIAIYYLRKQQFSRSTIMVIYSRRLFYDDKY